MIVVDTNIIAYMLFDTPHSATVDLLHKKNPEWHVPALWSGELLNVIAGYLRRNLIEYTKALELVQAATELIGPNEHKISPFFAMEFISRSTCSSYDCEFVALASRLETKLITYDKKILHDFPDTAIKPEDYLSQNS